MKQTDCGCESKCAECGKTSCDCGHVHAGHVHVGHGHTEMKHGGPNLEGSHGEESPSDHFDAPAETVPEVPAPVEEGQLEAPGNERAAKKFGTPRNAYKPVRFRGN